PSLISHRQPPEATPGGNNYCSSVTSTWLRQKRRQCCLCDVAGHRITPLTKPALFCRLSFNATSVQWNSVWLGWRVHGIDCAILRYCCGCSNAQKTENKCLD